MQSPENRALELFNQALKQCVFLSYEMQKNEAKNIVYNNLFAVKQCLNEVAEKIGYTRDIKALFNYYDIVKTNIDKI
jgi:hypothetical protein